MSRFDPQAKSLFVGWEIGVIGIDDVCGVKKSIPRRSGEGLLEVEYGELCSWWWWFCVCEVEWMYVCFGRPLHKFERGPP